MKYKFVNQILDICIALKKIMMLNYHWHILEKDGILLKIKMDRRESDVSVKNVWVL